MSRRRCVCGVRLSRTDLDEIDGRLRYEPLVDIEANSKCERQLTADVPASSRRLALYMYTASHKKDYRKRPHVANNCARC